MHGLRRQALETGLGGEPGEPYARMAIPYILTGRITEEGARQRKTVGQQTWMEKRSRAKAFDTLSARHKAGVLREEGRAEQKITDEHAAKGSRAEEPPE